MKKECTLCKVKKPVSNFYVRNKTPDGLQYHCKDCAKSLDVKWQKQNKTVKQDSGKALYQKNKKKIRRAYLKRKKQHDK